jgi:hypothetical protein
MSTERIIRSSAQGLVEEMAEENLTPWVRL